MQVRDIGDRGSKTEGRNSGESRREKRQRRDKVEEAKGRSIGKRHRRRD